MMEELFLRVLAVSAAVSLLLLSLLLCRGWLERTYAPQTRWALWLGVALVLLIAPWLPKPGAPVVVEAPVYTLTFPAARPVPVGKTPLPPVPEGVDPAGNGALSHQFPPTEEIVPEEADRKTVEPPAAASVLPASLEALPALSLTTLAGWTWLLGLAVILLWQGGRYLLFRRRLLRVSQPAFGLEEYASELGLEGKVGFYRCKAVSGPMTLGLLRPIVLLPNTELAPAALCHELCHIKRHDVAYKLLVLCACALHWFDPLVWCLCRWAGRDVEACCDAAVVAGQDSGYKRSYGELLLSVAEEPRSFPFATSFGGGKKQMKARLTQLFRPGKRSRALVWAVLALAVVLGSLVACRQEGGGELADGVYCSPYANVVYPLGEAEAEGEDYGSIRLSLLRYSEIEGPHGKPLGEYTLPLSGELMLRQLWWGEDRSAGEKGNREWQKAVHELVHTPLYRDSLPQGTEYLVVTVKDGEIVRLSWALVDRGDTPGADASLPLGEALTENTMPTLDYYDLGSGFLVYHTRHEVYMYYGEYSATHNSGGDRLIGRVEVDGENKIVYLSECGSDGSESRTYGYDAAARLEPLWIDGIPDVGFNGMNGIGEGEMRELGFGGRLHSNGLVTPDGTQVVLTVDEQVGTSMEYLQLFVRRDGEDSYRFLTPDTIGAPGSYQEPDWGFTLVLPDDIYGSYVVSRAANNWNFYDKELYPAGGYLFSLWAEDQDTQMAAIESYPGQWPGKILGEKDGITYTATFWEEDMLTPAERENEEYMARMEAAKELDAQDLDLSAVTRTSGYLWPLPYTDYGSDVLLGEEDNTLQILSPEGVTVQCVAGGRVEAITTHPITGEQTVYVRHPDGRYSVYSHLEYIQLESGAEVKRGGIIGFAGKEDGLRWLSFTLMEGSSWDTAYAIDPWSVDYRTYDFQPLDRDRVTMAGDPNITAVLRDVVYGNASFYDREREAYFYVDTLPESDGVPVTVRCFAELDLDGDTIPEEVLWLQRGEEDYLLGSMVLHYENGGVYGYPMGYRSLILETLKTDGTFQWNSSAFEWGWARMDFHTGKGKKVTWCENRGSQWEKYYVSGREAQVEDFEAEYQIQIAKPDVTWYSVSDVNPGGVERSVPAIERDWMGIVKSEQEEMQYLCGLSEQPSLDMEGLRYFSPEELTELEYGGTRLRGKPLTHTMGFEFAPIQGAPSTPEALRQRLEEQFTPELADEEYRFALEGSRPRCLFAEGKMWRRVIDWDRGLRWEYDWSTFEVIDSGEDFVSYQISGYRSDKPETIKTRHFTLQLEQEGDGASLWRYSARS